MRIKVNLEKVNSKYLDEIFYIKDKYRNCISKNPRQKPKSYMKEKIKWIMLLFIIIIYSIFTMYFSVSKTNLVIHVVLLALSLIAFIINFVNYKAVKLIKKNLSNKKYDIILEFTDTEVTYEEENIRKLTLSWDCIEIILVNKYSIIFIPKDNNITWLAIASDFKNEIIEAVEKYKKKNLIVDNTIQEECNQRARKDMKIKKKISIILNVVIAMFLGGAFLYVYNLEPEVVLKDNLRIVQNDKVYNDYFVEKVVNGEVISKKEIIDSSDLGKKQLVLKVKNDFNKEFEFSFLIEVVEEK